MYVVKKRLVNVNDFVTVPIPTLNESQPNYFMFHTLLFTNKFIKLLEKNQTVTKCITYLSNIKNIE